MRCGGGSGIQQESETFWGARLWADAICSVGDRLRAICLQAHLGRHEHWIFCPQGSAAAPISVVESSTGNPAQPRLGQC